jgi:hypothetical protein
MFFTILQAVHGGKGYSFLNGWKEEDPDCKFPTLHPCCIEEKAWKCRWKIREVTAFQERETKLGAPVLPNCHVFGKMQPGCNNGENLQSGSSSFYPSKKKPLTFPVMS